jgi:hypothetical protein
MKERRYLKRLGGKDKEIERRKKKKKKTFRREDEESMEIESRKRAERNK